MYQNEIKIYIFYLHFTNCSTKKGFLNGENTEIKLNKHNIDYEKRFDRFQGYLFCRNPWFVLTPDLTI